MTSKRRDKNRYGNHVLILPFVLLIFLILINIALLATLKATFFCIIFINISYLLSVAYVFKFFNSKLLNFVFLIVILILTYFWATSLISNF